MSVATLGTSFRDLVAMRHIQEMTDNPSVMMKQRPILTVEWAVSDSPPIPYHAHSLTICDEQNATSLDVIVKEAAESQIQPLPTTLTEEKS